MKKAILLVGDQETVRSALHKRLEMVFPRYQISEAAGEEAIALVLSQSPYVVIVDIGPPATQGFEVARRIKTIQPTTQMVIWTVHEWETYRADAVAVGATAYVLKENTSDELLPVLTALLCAEARPDSYHLQTTEEGGSDLQGTPKEVIHPTRVTQSQEANKGVKDDAIRHPKYPPSRSCG